MKIIQNALLSSYKVLRKSSLFQTPLAQTLFLKSYFQYKKHIEDPFFSFFKLNKLKFAPGNFLDVGANIGYTATLFSENLVSPFKVHAFEPESENIILLKKVIVSKNLESKVVINPCACGETSGVITLWKNRDHHADNRIVTDTFKASLDTDKECYEVPIISLDDYSIKNDLLNFISFVKIDVQGFELAVLKGMSKIIELNPKIIIAFEYSPAQMKDLGFKNQDLMDFFKDFNLYILKKNGQISETNDQELLRNYQNDNYIDIVATKFKLL